MDINLPRPLELRHPPARYLGQAEAVTFLGVLSVSYNTLFIFKNSKPGSKSKENRADDLCIKAINRRQDLLFSRDIIDPAARVARLATTTLLLYKLSAWLACLPCPNQLCIPAWLFQQRQQGRAAQGRAAQYQTNLLVRDHHAHVCFPIIKCHFYISVRNLKIFQKYPAQGPGS